MCIHMYVCLTMNIAIIEAATPQKRFSSVLIQQLCQTTLLYY